MFDIGWQELFIVAVLGLIVVGPKDLPRALRTIMGLVRKGRMMARDFQDGLDEVVREADLDDMKNKIENLTDDDITSQVQDALDPTGDLAGDLGMNEIQEDLDEAVKDHMVVDETVDTDAVAPPPSSPVGEEAKTSDPDPDKDA
ncbi:MAG TPA: Sec-independent protein translocase protein TatB [Rhodospirillales bacterium]|nr:Sec-independent protein translocase protein TatB [Rhodospirillales bacterium]